MIHLLGPRLPNEFWIACSGGVDSMAAWHFFSQKPYRKVKLAFFHHGTENSERALHFLRDFFGTIEVGYLDGEKSSRESPEEFWRNKRYEFLNSLDGKVVLGHHLDDAVENWIFSSLHGNPYTIPYSNKNVIRPFLLTKKSELVSWCERKGVPWIEDTSNGDVRYMRNLIRKEIVPQALRVNPGLHKVVRRKILEENQF